MCFTSVHLLLLGYLSRSLFSPSPALPQGPCRPLLSTEVTPPPPPGRQHLAASGDICGCHNRRVEARLATKHSATCRTALAPNKEFSSPPMFTLRRLRKLAVVGMNICAHLNSPGEPSLHSPGPWGLMGPVLNSYQGKGQYRDSRKGHFPFFCAQK